MLVTAVILIISSRNNKISDSEVRARARELGMVQGNELLIGTEVSGNSNENGAELVSDNAIKISTDEEKSKNTGGKSTSSNSTAKDDKSSTQSSDTASGNSTEKPRVTFSSEKSSAVQSAAQSVNNSSSEVRESEDTAVEVSPESDDFSDTDAKKEDVSATAGSSSGKSSAAAQGETYVLHISRGESSYAAAKALEEAGIIASAVDFDKYLVSQGIDRKIDAGDHTVPTSGTYEEIGQALLR